MFAQLLQQVTRPTVAAPETTPARTNAGVDAMRTLGETNRERVADLIERTARPIGTTEMAKRLHLSRATCDRHANDLLAEDPPRIARVPSTHAGHGKYIGVAP
jgi:response regulator of citrate/malate metabolism